MPGVGVEVAQVGADDDERLGPAPVGVDHGGNLVGAGVADDDCQQRELAERSLEERDVDLEAVLEGVGGVVDGEVGPLEGDGAERRVEAVGVGNGDAPERHAVRRAQQDDARDLVPVAHARVGAGRHRPRVHVAGVGRDERLRRSLLAGGGRGRGAGEGLVDGGPQGVGTGRVEGAGNRRGARAHGYSAKSASRTGRRLAPQSPGGPSNTPGTVVPHSRQRPSSVTRYSPSTYQSRSTSRMPHPLQYVLEP